MGVDSEANVVRVSRNDALRGVIVGAIVGDAFGSVLEGLSARDAVRPVARRAHRATPWRYTDDGAMVLAVAESLLARRTVDPFDMLRSLARWYDPVRGFGKGLKLAVRAFEREYRGTNALMPRGPGAPTATAGSFVSPRWRA